MAIPQNYDSKLNWKLLYYQSQCILSVLIGLIKILLCHSAFANKQSFKVYSLNKITIWLEFRSMRYTETNPLITVDKPSSLAITQ